MKKILISAIASAIIINPFFVLAQTDNSAPAPVVPVTSVKSKKITAPPSLDPPVYVGDTPSWARDLIKKIDNLSAKFEKLTKVVENLSGGGGGGGKPPICPIVTSFPLPCPAGQTHGPDTTDVNSCNWPGPCVPIKPPEPVTTCVGGYELYGGSLCFNRLTGLVYKLKDGVETAITLVKYAAKEWGTSIGSCNGTIQPNSSATGIECKYAPGGGDCGSWTKIAWNYTVSSCVDPNNVTQQQIEAGKGIVNACTGATGQSSFRWSAGGVPELCLTTGTGGGGGGSTVLPASWEACLNKQGTAAGVAQSKIGAALVIIKTNLTNKEYINYSAMDSGLYSSIANCDKETGFYISNQGGGSGGGGGGGGTGGYTWDTAKTSCVAGLITARGETFAKAQTIANNFALCASSAGCTSLDDVARADMSKYGAEGSSSQCWSYGGGGTTGGGTWPSGSVNCDSYTTQGTCPTANGSCVWGTLSGYSAPACKYPGAFSGSGSGGSSWFDCSSLTNMLGYTNYTGWHSMGDSNVCFTSGMERYVDVVNQAPSGEIKNCTGSNTPKTGCASAPTALSRTSLVAQLLSWLIGR